jgi:hypothetical protein
MNTDLAPPKRLREGAVDTDKYSVASVPLCEAAHSPREAIAFLAPPATLR